MGKRFKRTIEDFVCENCGNQWEDELQIEINVSVKGIYKKCECGKLITQENEFRCFNCWEADTKTAFGE